MDRHDEAKPGGRHHLREVPRIDRRESKFGALFVLVILSFPSLASVRPGCQEVTSADTKEPRIALANALPRLGQACSCFFTIDGVRGKKRIS